MFSRKVVWKEKKFLIPCTKEREIENINADHHLSSLGFFFLYLSSGSHSFWKTFFIKEAQTSFCHDSPPSCECGSFFWGHVMARKHQRCSLPFGPGRPGRDLLASCGNEFLWALIFMPHFPVGGTRYFWFYLCSYSDPAKQSVTSRAFLWETVGKVLVGWLWINEVLRRLR